MKILVTGGSGFLGQHLVKALQKAGYTDIRIFNRNPCDTLQNVEFVCGHLEDYQQVKKAVNGCEVVFHVAAKAGIWGCYRSYYNTNVLGTEHIIKACKDCHVKYLVYTSSPSVVFNNQPLVNVDERIGYGNPKKMCAYAHTKMLAEQLILRANNEKGLQTIALRPHLIWGPGDNHLIPTLLDAARRHRLFQVGDGKNWVDMSYVTNVAQAHLLALEAIKNTPHSVSGKAYFISQGDPVQLWPWVHLLLSKLDIPQPSVKIPASLAYGIGLLCEILYKVLFIKKQPPMTRFVAKELSEDHYFNISMAKMDLHYIPKISNEEGLEQLVAWLKNK